MTRNPEHARQTIEAYLQESIPRRGREGSAKGVFPMLDGYRRKYSLPQSLVKSFVAGRKRSAQLQELYDSRLRRFERMCEFYDLEMRPEVEEAGKTDVYSLIAANAMLEKRPHPLAVFHWQAELMYAVAKSLGDGTADLLTDMCFPRSASDQNSWQPYDCKREFAENMPFVADCDYVCCPPNGKRR